MAASEPVQSAMAPTTTAWASDTRRSSRAFSTRSASRPASPPSATTGPNSARKKAETASAEPVVASMCSARGTQSRKSPKDGAADGADQEADVAGAERGHAPECPPRPLAQRSATVKRP